MTTVENGPLDLHTCEDEPIHIPGSIQSHGALVVFDDQLVVQQVSANIGAFTGVTPEDLLFKRLPDHLFAPGTIETILRDVQLPDDQRDNHESLNPSYADSCEITFHCHRGLWFAEFLMKPRLRATIASGIRFQRALSRMQSADSVERLLDVAVSEIRRLTGIDRVMAYRFLPGGHGQVVCESCREGIGSYVGMHYPASDIPAQARRLYALSPVRWIHDVTERPVALVPLLNEKTQAPTDLSLTTLRSVSPIHCEYLTNMGVRGSMSGSIVIAGELWGLFACHHYEPLRLPYATRLAVYMLSLNAAILISALEVRRKEKEISGGEALIRQLMVSVDARGDVLSGLQDTSTSLLRLVGADAFSISLNSRVVHSGHGPSSQWVGELIRWLSERAINGPFLTTNLVESGVPPEPTNQFKGLLALPFHPTQRGYLLFFRNAVIQTVSWAGNPHEGIKSGPLGARLTPRGSFELFQEVVSDTCHEWTESQQALAASLGESLTHRVLDWTSEQDRLRNFLVGMVGHDLRTPLGAIRMGAELLGEENKIGRRLSSSSTRMTELVEALMDLNQIQSDRGLGIAMEPINTHEMCEALVQEMLLAYPGVQINTRCSGSPVLMGDQRRLEQAVSNLLSNATQHGETAKGITLSVRSDAGQRVEISVHNWGTPIPPAERDVLLQRPYQGVQRRAERRSGGLGIGLFIAQSIAKAHGGKIRLDSSEAEGTSFTLVLPRKPQAPALQDRATP